MKKMMLVLAVLVAGATSVYAVSPVETGVFYTINNEPVFNRLMRYLDADGEQSENLKYIFEATTSKLKTAAKDGNDAAYSKAVNFNLANAKNILTRSQYIKYLSMINLTLTNRYQELALSEK
ncbi:MAG: hypothetical protein H6Q17_141 [Bacteroidetes bacterium]|jgi:hypothetical protein|nr:hypothetical protein [Bacteroidota bacterium]